LKYYLVEEDDVDTVDKEVACDHKDFVHKYYLQEGFNKEISCLISHYLFVLRLESLRQKIQDLVDQGK